AISSSPPPQLFCCVAHGAGFAAAPGFVGGRGFAAGAELAGGRGFAAAPESVAGAGLVVGAGFATGAGFAARTISSSSDQSVPGSSCSLAERAECSRRSACAGHDEGGTVNANSNAVQAVGVPNSGSLPPSSLAAHMTLHRSPLGPRSSPLYLPCSR